jgi:hypothetical protein
MFRERTPAGSEAERRFLSPIPMKRLGTPDEIAATIDAAGIDRDRSN